MPSELTFLAAFVTGLLGATHCIGMCGGIVSSLSLGVKDLAQNPTRLLAFLLSYNLGRILSYILIGAIAGLLGQQLSYGHIGGVSIAQLIAGLFMIFLGLYLANWWRGLVQVEKLGAYLWRWIEPLGRRFLPVSNPIQAFALGMVWGWLPCGLVYTMVVWSLSSGSLQTGAWLMLGFGLGTLPMLLLMGTAMTQLNQLRQKAWIRTLAGVLVILMGIYSLLLAFK